MKFTAREIAEYIMAPRNSGFNWHIGRDKYAESDEKKRAEVRQIFGEEIMLHLRDGLVSHAIEAENLCNRFGAVFAHAADEDAMKAGTTDVMPNEQGSP